MNENEYKAVRESGAGIVEFPNRGLIEVSGGEAVQFLNGLITNDVKTLADQTWMRAAFPNAQGRLLAMVRVLRVGDKFLFDVDAANYAAILANLTRFTFAGDFKVNDLSAEYTMISLAAHRDFKVEHLEVNITNPNHSVSVSNLDDGKVFTVHSQTLSSNGFDCFVHRESAPVMCEFYEQFGAVRLSAETLETLRIEQGTPLYGVDMDETTVVLETGIDEAVSFNKGCYIGQEIIARIHFRGHVAKKLTGLILSEPVAPSDILKSRDGKNAGKITSTVFSPLLNKHIALAYVRYEFLPPETELFAGENQISAVVTQLPFVR